MEGGEDMKGKLLLSDNISILYHQLEGKERVLFMDAVFNYHENGIEPSEEVGRLVLMAFKVFKVEYDRDQDKYEEKCEKLRNNARSRKADASKSNQMQADASKSNQIESNNNNNSNSNNIVSNETEEDKEEADKPLSSPPVLLSERYTKFISWFVENCPHLKKMEQPAEDQFFELLETAGNANKLRKILLDMENNKETPSKRRSVYLTAMNWLNRDLKK